MYTITYTSPSGEKRIEVLATTQQVLDSIYILDRLQVGFTILVRLDNGDYVDITR